MKTVVCIEIEHDRPIPALANLVAGRAWTINGVTGAEVMEAQKPFAVQALRSAGFNESEIALGMTEVVRA
jgi:hypothetical protein